MVRISSDLGIGRRLATIVMFAVLAAPTASCQAGAESRHIAATGQSGKQVEQPPVKETGQSTAEVVPGDLQAIIHLSRTNLRPVWWPAVEQLGKLANVDDSVRDDIWALAGVNTLGMKFVEVQPGTFLMGPDMHRIFNIQEAHRVRISKGYFISLTEVTNAQLQQLFPRYEPDPVYSPDPDSPAVDVLWEDADQFCKLLSEKEGVTYRLPTEAEWECACRAGSTSRFCFGNDPAELPQYGWCSDANTRASRVAMLKSNDWGIYDMHGNAIEWVSDWFSSMYYSVCAAKGVVEDPQGPTHGRSHVLRSGPWKCSNPWACSSTARFPRPILDRVPFDFDSPKIGQQIGFRVVRELHGGK